MTNLVLRNDDLVCDDVIDEWHAHRSTVREVARLHGGGPMGKNSRSRPTQLTIEVNRDVDFHFADHRSDLGISQSPHIDETLERGLDPAPHRASIVGAQRNRGGLETRSVVMLEHAGNQDRSRVIVEFCGEISNPDPVMAIIFAKP